MKKDLTQQTTSAEQAQAAFREAGRWVVACLAYGLEADSHLIKTDDDRWSGTTGHDGPIRPAPFQKIVIELAGSLGAMAAGKTLNEWQRAIGESDLTDSTELREAVAILARRFNQLKTVSGALIRNGSFTTYQTKQA